MIAQRADFLRLRWLVVLLLSLLWATMGSAAALAERGDFGASSRAANSAVKITRPGGSTIYGEIPGVGKVHGVSYGDTMWIENIVVQPAARLQGNSVRLYEALLNEAPATRVFRGEPGSVNLEVLKRTGDINLTPRAKALNQLGFTQHEYDAVNNVMISTKP